MKQGLLFFLIICSHITLGQSISAPAPLSIEANASNVDAGDFVVSWPSAPASILVSVSLEYQSGATLSFPTTTGLNLNAGYSTWTGVTSIVFYGSLTNINTALAAMTISMGSVKTAVKINLEVSSYDSNYYYNPTNKHFYRYVSGSVSYTTARTNAGSATYNFKGKTGYLVTITSQSEQDFINNNIVGNNIWIAITDEAVDGTWKLDGGPELGTIIKTQNGPTTGNIDGQYNNWCSGEPNGASHVEDYAVAKWNGGTCWNDLSNTNTTGISGYIVEISADFPAGSDYTGVYASYTVHNNDIAYTKSSSSGISSAGISNVVNLSGGLTINNGHTLTLNANNSFKSNKITFNGSGKLVLNSTTSKWMPENASTDNTIVYSPAKNTNPVNWDTKSIWAGDLFIDNNQNANHITPWLGSPQAWSALNNDVTQYITLIYPIPAYIAGIATQGRQNMAQWVKNADIEVSLNGTTNWTTIKTNATLNTDQTSIVNVLFDQPVYAKYVRVKLTRTTDWYNHTSMRLGLIIKSYDFNIITDGLKLRLDAGESSSYGGSGTTWSDISGNTQHFSLVNSPTYNASGYFSFNGSTQYASIPHNNTLKPTAAITMEQWLNATNWAAGTSTAYKCSLSCTQGGGYSHNIWSNTFYSYIYIYGSYRILSYSVSGFTGWHHFVSTFDGRYVRLYVDGQNVNNIDFAASGYTMTYASNSIFIGAEAGATTAPEGYYWDGKIGTTLIYNRALSTAEVLQNYLNTKAKYGL